MERSSRAPKAPQGPQRSLHSALRAPVEMTREELARAPLEMTKLTMNWCCSWSTPEFIRAAVQLAPARIVYISCNPKTQERDLREFARHGYQATKIQPVDMFPHTDHTECVVLIEKAPSQPR